ncbi:MAG: ACP S-malonyltransferase [Treponema sp.]|nr:ACP S-malonyltransferase [Treponema sp.]
MAAKHAFLFPGQGAQTPGMIKDVAEAFPAAKKVLDDISQIAGTDVPKLLWESDAETLSRSDNSQLAITAASLAICAALKEKGIVPTAALGFSLGEFPALHIAGVLSFEDVIKVVLDRGRIMQAVCEKIAAENEGHAPGMSAILGLPPEKVAEIAASIPDAYAANLNSSVQTVISGTEAALEKAEAAAKEAGARRAVRLKVAGPFHSPLMQRAADEFEKAIAGVTFNNPTIKLFSNVTGKEETSGENAKKSAVLHLTHPVRWTDEEDVLAALVKADGGEWKLLEPGPGQVLSGLWAKTAYAESLKCVPVNSAEAISGDL